MADVILCIPNWYTAEYMTTQGAKKQVAVRIPLREKAALEAEAAEKGISRSEYIRSILRDRGRVTELEDRLETRDNRIDELETQLAERSQIESKIENLPDRIRGEVTYQDRRQQMLDRASPMQRLKWKITGVPVEVNGQESV